MKLNQLLKEVTPLPWKPCVCDADGYLIEADHTTVAHLPESEPPILVRRDAEYLTHAANLFPELAKILRVLIESEDKDSWLGFEWDLAREILHKAENIN